MMRCLLRALRAVAAALGTLMLAVTVLPVEDPWIRALEGPRTDASGDILIVLGNDANSDGTIGLPSYWRAVYAARAWPDGFREVVISGGGGAASAIRDFVVAEGVPREAVRLEERAQSTRENALFVADMLRESPGRKVLLTSDFHMFRAWRAFREAGLETTPRPLPDAYKRTASLANRWPLFLDLVVETAKIAGYKLRGWI